MRIAAFFLLTPTLFAQPELFILPTTGSIVIAATPEPFATTDTFNTRNTPAFFFRSADGAKYYSVARSATDTLVVLDASSPGIVLQRLNLSVPLAAILTPDRRRLLIAGAGGLHVIDTATDAAVATIPVSSAIDVAASSDGRFAYVLSNQLITIDLTTNTVRSTLPLVAGASAVAVNHTGLVYVSAPSRVYEIHGRTGQLLREIPIPGTPGRLVFTPNARTALAVNRATTGPDLFRIDLASEAIVGESATTARTLLDAVFMTGPNRGYASSSQTQAVYEVTVAPLRFDRLQTSGSASPDATSGVASREFPSARSIYLSRPSSQQAYSNLVYPPAAGQGFAAMGRVVAAPPAITGSPAFLYAFNTDGSYSLPLITRVTDRLGRPLSGVLVTFSTGARVLSNADGWAQIDYPSYSIPWPISVRATAGAATAVFPLGSAIPPPATISVLSGQGQAGVASRFFPSPFRVVVRDAEGYPVANTEVTFSKGPGAGHLFCPLFSTCYQVTDANGQVEVGFVPYLVDSGYSQVQIRVSVRGAPPRVLYITTISDLDATRRSAILTAMETIEPTSGSLSGLVNSVLPDAIRLRTSLPNAPVVGLPIPNVALSIAAPLEFPDLACDGEGGVTLSNTNGVATCSLQLGSVSGTVNLRENLKVGGNLGPSGSDLSVTIFPDGVPSLRVVEGSGQTLARDAISAAIVVRALNAVSQPLANQSIQWTVEPSVGLVLLTPSGMTDASGRAAVTVQSGTVAGIYKLRALVGGLSVDIPILVLDRVQITPNFLAVGAAATVFALDVVPSPPQALWTVEGLPDWLTTFTRSGTGPTTVWLQAAENLSLTSVRVAYFRVGGATVQVVQFRGQAPRVFAAPAVASSGLSNTFSLNITGQGGFSSVGVVNLLIRDALDGRAACYIAYSVPLNVLYLVSDAGPDALSSPLTLGSAGSVSNSQCTVFGTGSSPPGFFNNLDSFSSELRLRITFNPSFAGPKLVYAAARDTRDRTYGWDIIGTHTVPGPVTLPRPVNVVPAVSDQLNPVISFTFDDQTDARNIETAWVLINNALDARLGCYIAFHNPSNQLFLFPDSGLATGLTNRPVLGPGVLSNSQCSLDITGTAVSRVGARLTLTLPYRFSASWRMTKGIWTAVQSLSGQRSTWQGIGVVSPPN